MEIINLLEGVVQCQFDTFYFIYPLTSLQYDLSGFGLVLSGDILLQDYLVVVGEGYGRYWWVGRGGKEGGLSWSNCLYPCYLDHFYLLYREAFLLFVGGGYEVEEEVFCLL